jgi:DNA repair protein SbcC/Rad50
MRPHRLRVTAFGAFAATEQVSFDDLEGLFLLHGETGAGKTTLLDAIAFALYGRVPGERGTARRLRSDHAAPRAATEVELEATIGGRRLRITRRPEQDRPKKSGSGTTKEQASVRLEERPAGDWEVKSTRIGEADKEIIDLIGMSAEQFFQVVLLPQGEFARFLRADAKDKEALLQKLFGTDRFRKVEDWLADRRRATDKEVAAAEEGVGQLLARIAQAAGGPVPDSAAVLDSPELAALPAALDQADARAASRAWQATWAAVLAAMAAAERDAAAAFADARKGDLEARLIAQREAERLADRQRRRLDALRRRAGLEAATPEIEWPRAGSGVGTQAVAARAAEAAALHCAAQEQQAKVGRLEALRAVAGQADAEDEAAVTARSRAAGLAVDLDVAEAEALQRRAARPRAEQARDTASQAAADLPSAQGSADRARRVASDAAALVAEHARRGELREAHLSAREKSLAAQAGELRVRGARIDGMRAELAASMTDGSPCPVCGSLDHPDPVDADSFPAVSRDEEDAATALASEAARAADEAGRRVAAVDAVLGDLAQRLAGAGFEFPAAAGDAPGPAAVSAGPVSEGAGAPAATLTGALTWASLDAGSLADAARAAAADACEREARAGLLSGTAARLTGLQRELDELDQAIAAGKARLAELTEQRAAALAAADAADDRAARHRAELAAQLGGAGDLETAIGSATRQADALLKAAAVADLLADPDLDVTLDPPAPVNEATEAARAAQLAHDKANAAYGTAEDRADQLALLRPRLEDALAALEPLKGRAGQIRQLADLANGTGGANQYKMTLSSFVLAARLEEVAAAASERLLTMTAGRYSLVHSDARKGNAKAGLGLLACDTWTGIDRDTATLSGGETFLASLALALGLADVVTAESAGTRLEALFVDEGFGTLDEDTLDEVMNVLDGLRAGGRIVGIVSHVSELRQRIPAQVHVRKGRGGSHVEIIPVLFVWPVSLKVTTSGPPSSCR